MSTKTLANIRDQTSIELHDYHHSTVTTALAATNNLVDTELANVKGGTTDNFCTNWWVLVTSENNDGEIRRVTTYTASSKTIVTLGNAWTAETAGEKATYELHKYYPTDKTNAINTAVRKVFPAIYRPITDLSLVSGNILPNSHFEDWDVTTVPNFYRLNGATAVATTTPPYFRGETTSAKITTSSNNAGILISAQSGSYSPTTASDYPRLIDLKNTTISFYSWVYPEVEDDVKIEIYTAKADGTEQTLSSTTSAPAAKWTLLKLENQAINDAIQHIQIRFYVKTSGNYAYFDSARLVGRGINDYMLPKSLQNGQVTWVRRQVTGSDTEKPCDDIGFDVGYKDIFGWNIVTEDVFGTNYKFLRTPNQESNSYRFELTGYAPLKDDLSSDTDTVVLSDPHAELVVAYAMRELYKMERGTVSSETSDKYDREIIRLDLDIIRMTSGLGMMRPVSQLRVRR